MEKKAYAAAIPSVEVESYETGSKVGQFPCEYEYLTSYDPEKNEPLPVKSIKKPSVWLDQYLTSKGHKVQSLESYLSQKKIELGILALSLTSDLARASPELVLKHISRNSNHMLHRICQVLEGEYYPAPWRLLSTKIALCYLSLPSQELDPLSGEKVTIGEEFVKIEASELLHSLQKNSLSQQDLSNESFCGDIEKARHALTKSLMIGVSRAALGVSGS